jgi:hypothetical protein
MHDLSHHLNAESENRTAPHPRTHPHPLRIFLAPFFAGLVGQNKRLERKSTVHRPRTGWTARPGGERLPPLATTAEEDLP